MFYDNNSIGVNVPSEDKQEWQVWILCNPTQNSRDSVVYGSITQSQNRSKEKYIRFRKVNEKNWCLFKL